MDDCRQMGISAVRFTGGEPLLYQQLPALLKAAKKRHFYTLVNTNALYFSDDLKKDFRKYVDNVLVSLHGYNALTEAWLTGLKSGFSKKIRNIFTIKSCVPVVRIGTIMSDIFLKNKPYYNKLLFEGLKTEVWELYRPMHQKKETGSLTCDRRDLNRVAVYLIHASKTYGVHCVIGNAIPFCCLEPAMINKGILLGGTADDGHSRLVYDARGFFKPSYFIDYNLGENLGDAWNNPFLRALRSLRYLPQKCLDCRYLDWCKGGSRKSALDSTGNVFDSDPWMPGK